jgi:hypothetical protein
MPGNGTIENAKIPHYSTTIGRSDDAGRRWLCPADSASEPSGNDSSGSSSHNSESSGKNGGNSSENRGACSTHNSKTEVQLRAGNEHRDRLFPGSEEAVGGSGLESGRPGIERSSDERQDASDGRRSEGRAERSATAKFRNSSRKRCRRPQRRTRPTAKLFSPPTKVREGVVTLPDGLQYKIVKAGDGPKPTATDTVVCNYRGHVREWHGI